MMQQQDNVLLTLLPGTSLNLPSDQGVYELQTLNLEGSPGLWSQTLVERVRAWAGSADSRSRMVGAWRSVLGPTHLAAVLWQHENPDCCLTLRDTIDSLSQKEEMTFHITGGHSKLLLPHAVSNLQ
ncbi:uncharacterized protein LOC121853952 [Homarus americanus]|nr:uncharacterized protein LOC121853952 [Homarus americanus]